MTRIGTFGSAFLAWLLGIATMFVALGPRLAEASPEKKELIIWGLALTPDTKGQEAVIREFERRNPDLSVRILSMGAGRMNPQKLMTSIVGNVAPDVINQDRFSTGDWASRGAFLPLDDLMARDAGKDPDCPKPQDYYPAAWQEAKYDGKVYAIPTGADDRILYYNKALFRENAAALKAAGLDAERPPRTWSEVLAYSKILTKRNPDGTLARAGWLPNFGNTWLYMFAFQMNASFMSADNRTCTMYTPAAEKALQFMVDGYDLLGGYEKAKAFETGFQGGENDAFLIGKVAMKVDGDWILKDLIRYGPRLDLGVAPPPVPDDRFYKRGDFKDEKETFITWVGGFSLAIPRGACNVEGAWRFIKFATSVEGRILEHRAQREWERSRGRDYVPRMSASIPANAVILKEFKPSVPKFAAALKQHVDMAPFGKTRPPTFVGQRLWDEHVRAMENATLGRMSPKVALLQGQAVVQRELDVFYAKEKLPIVDLRIPVAIFVGLAVLGAALLYLGYRKLRLGKLARQEARWAYLFLSPWLIGFFVFTLGPMLASLFFSFTRYDVLSEPRWFGTQNYQDLFTSDWPNVSKSFGNVLYLAAYGVPIGVLTGLAIAMLLNSAVRGMRYYRTLFYLPAIVPTVASAVLWIWVLTPDANKGLLNSAWQATLTQWMNLPPPGWLNAEAWAKNSLIMMGLWGAGSGMVLWLAGLKGIPNTLYEAASIDGASPKQQFFAVTLPQLSPIIFFNTVMGFIGSLQEFDRVYIMKPAEGSVGPGDSLLVPIYHLFSNAFSYFKMGYASALAWLMFGVILVLTLIQFKLAPKWVHYEVDK